MRGTGDAGILADIGGTPLVEAVDRDYEQIRIGMQTLFADLGISAAAA